MRFFTLDGPGINVGLSAAEQRAPTLVYIDGDYRPGTLKAVLLRVKPECLLSRRFGLDYSWGEVRKWRENLAATLSVAEFLSCIRDFGVISVYDVIPPYQLELCTTDGKHFLSERSSTHRFAPLLTFDLANPGARPETERA
jgi:hypothetical protein